MTLKEFKKRVLGMIEELDTEDKRMTSDEDIANKFNDVTNMVMFEMSRMKKIPDMVEMQVKKGDWVRFDDIARVSGYEVYQIIRMMGVPIETRAEGTIIKVLADGVLEIEYYRYPERITDKTSDSYEFELSQDALEIMAYGVAGDLLKTDVSMEYGQIFSNRYEQMLSRLDYRHSTGMFTIEGGVDI